MPSPAHESLWNRLHRQWLESHPPRLADPRLAADARVAPTPPGLLLNPLLIAWIR